MTPTAETSAARPRLRLWHPGATGTGETVAADGEQARHGYVVDFAAGVADQDQVSLAHAASRNGIACNLFRSDDALNGLPWYDNLPRITGMYIDVTTRGETTRLRCPGKEGKRDEIERSGNSRPDQIVVGALVRTEKKQRRTLRLATDFAVGAESRNDPSAAGIRVAKDSGLDVDSLKTLIRHALGSPAAKPGGRQRMLRRSDFDKLARKAAADLLQDEQAVPGNNRRHHADGP